MIKMQGAGMTLGLVGILALDVDALIRGRAI